MAGEGKLFGGKFLVGPFVPGIRSIYQRAPDKPEQVFRGWPRQGPRIVTYDDGRVATFRGGDYEQLWYRARCWFYKRNGEPIPS